ncbi:MAG: ATP-binding protein [Lachnospiraceae bacterium]|nr:ATP-binding protein [Lachnospiraceae bacterium]
MSLISRLTPSQRASLQREYDQIRMRDLDEQDRRRAWAKEQCPQLFEIRSQIAAISSQAARDRILNKTQEGPDYSERIGELVERQQMYLDNLDVPRDFLDPVFECPKCHDTGFLPDGQPCSCYISKAVRLVYGSMNNRNLDPDASFASFSLDWYSTEPGPDGQSPRTKAETVLKQAKDFAARIGAGHGYANMLLYGNPGTGKTFLTNCIVSELLQSNINVIYFSAVDLFEALSYTSRQKQNAESVQDAAFVTECDLLVIDDLGTEMTNAFTRSILFDVINTRLNLHKSTLISTNLPPSGLRTLYTERISSRIMGNYHVWQLTGEDIRILKLKKAGAAAAPRTDGISS